MRPLPSAENLKQEEQNERTVDHHDQIVENALHIMQFGAEGNTEYAVKQATQTYIRKNNGYQPDKPLQQLQAEIEQQIAASLPNGLDFETEISGDDEVILTNVSGGCPNCGNKSVFNGISESHNQWVASDGKLKVDDRHEKNLIFLICASCGTSVYDTRED